MKYQLRSYFVLLALIVFCSGCTNDLFSEDNKPSEFKLVTFSLKSSFDNSLSSSDTSLPDGQFTFCFFNAGSEHSSKLVYQTSLAEQEMHKVNGNYTVSIHVPADLKGKMKLVALFNFAPNANYGISYKNFRNLLSYIVPNSSNTEMPMWGEMDFEMKGGTNLLKTTTLLRSYARVNVMLDKQDEQAKYKMQDVSSVRIYLSRSYGSVYPFPANFDETTMSVKKPSIPVSNPASGMYHLGNGRFTNDRDEALKFPLLYDYNEAPTKLVFNNIFVPEVSHKSSQDFRTTMCVVVGVHLEGLEGVERFYRLDFASYDANKRPVNFNSILRNKSYNFHLKGASTSGFPNPEDAFDNPIPVFMDVKVWEDYTQEVDITTSFYFKHDYKNTPFDGKIYQDVFLSYDTDLSPEQVKQNLKFGFGGNMNTTEGAYFSVIGISYENKYMYLRSMTENNTGKEKTEMFHMEILNQKFNIKLVQNSL